MSSYRRGQTWVPDRGDHEGHTVRVVSNDARQRTLKDTLPDHVVRHVLVRCDDCLESWTFGEDP